MAWYDAFTSMIDDPLGSSGDSSIGSFLPDAVSTVTGGGGDSGSSWWQSPALWNTVIGAGSKLFSDVNAQDNQDAANKRADDAAKFAAMIELAKLKYAPQKGGGGGGGGGSKVNKNKDLIDVLSGGTNQTLTALDQLTRGIQTPLDVKRSITGY